MIEQAIVVRDARKSYDKGHPVLDRLSLTVSKGSIYGLLGASGCGKTTLLSCVVGVRKLDSGEIWVLGGRPGSKGSGIPGPHVGYMPQDISLVPEFSVIGALYYFGRINGLRDYEIEDQYGFLSKLLQLPPRDCLMKHASGGQQRRVSFAAALIHKPELLILDEPTVGLDPVLRSNIWDHLVKLTKDEGVTCVITTHYIEEAKQADKIGLMRCGKLLAESSPQNLLNHVQCESLEEAFLTLCQRQKENQALGIADVPVTEVDDIHSVAFTSRNYRHTSQTERKENYSPYRRVLRRFHALMAKNMIQFIRHPGGILFALLLPLVQVMVFFNAIGSDPHGLELAVVNDEAGNCDFGRNTGRVIYNETYSRTCNYVDLSCRFLDKFNEISVKYRYYDDLETAMDTVKTGETVGILYFAKNFSAALSSRQKYIISAPIADIVAGQIQVWLDMADRQIGLHMKKRLLELFFEAYEKIMKECHFPVKLADMPLRFEDPIFGKKDQKYSSFVAPSFLITLTFFISTSVTSVIIIEDRHEGVWDRSLVQGVTTAEILMAHLLTQLLVIVIQVSVEVSLSFTYFGLECKGSFSAVIWMVFLAGICGMSYGFLISVMCSSQTMANYASTGSFYPIILLCGCVWPVEGMPKLLRWFSFCLPTTVPSISLRGILDKGYPVYNAQVYSGFLVITAWILGLLTLCLIGLRSKKV